MKRPDSPLGSSAYDRQPVWLRWVIGIALFAWFVPPMIAVLIKLVTS